MAVTLQASCNLETSSVASPLLDSEAKERLDPQNCQRDCCEMAPAQLQTCPGFHILDDPGKWPVDELARREDNRTRLTRLVQIAGCLLA